MKRIRILLAIAILCAAITGCNNKKSDAQIAATTLPVYEFTAFLCQGTDITVTRLITEDVACLHNYTLQVNQMRVIEKGELVVISGAGLEDFMSDALIKANNIIDASANISLNCGIDHDHEEHHHENDPHIWLSPANAKAMANNIYFALTNEYPQHAETFKTNLTALVLKFDELSDYAAKQLANLSTREIITFHDGFGYMADAFGLTIIHSIEEESGAEASAAELIEIIDLINQHQLGEIFVETNGSTSAASIIATETGAKIFMLDMAIAGDSYFDAMYKNIDILKEALQ